MGSEHVDGSRKGGPGGCGRPRKRRSPEETGALRRARTERCRGPVLGGHLCADTGAGAVVYRDFDERISARYFRPGAYRRAFACEAIGSAHARMAVPDRLRELLAAAKAARTAPHDLEVGDMMVERGSMAFEFYTVVDVPHPRKVTILEPGLRVMPYGRLFLMRSPDEDAAPRKAEPRTRWVKTGPHVPRVRLDRGRTAERWHGPPPRVHCI